MGRPIRHFSHPHPLFPSSLSPQDHSSSCVVCKLRLLSLPSYTCQPCNFHIHVKCSELPQKIRHPFDKNHLLSLISSPKYQEGIFLCDACGKEGDGFAYHCGECRIDLHTDCANMPLRVIHQSHRHHQLSLTFSTSAGGSGSRSVAPGSFRCSVCYGPGSNSWLYNCKECDGFHAHLLCATGELPSPPNLVQHEPNRMQPQIIGTTPFANVPNPYSFVPNPVIGNPYPFGPNPVISNQSSFGTTSHMDLVKPFIDQMMNISGTNMPQDPSQVSQLMNLFGPLGMAGAGPVGASGSSSSSGSLGFDPSVFGSVNPSVFAGLDPSVYGSVNPSVFAGYDPSTFGSIDPSVFAGFDPSTFGSVDPSVLTGSDPSLLSTAFSALGFF